MEDIHSLPSSVCRFVPEGYAPLDTAYGDLNRDQYTDLILVLRHNGEDTSADDLNRPMLLLLGQPDDSWKKAAENDHVILCARCGGAKGDPFMQLVIKQGYFSAEFYGGASQLWTRTITFRYAPEQQKWLLHKDGSSSWYCCDDEHPDEKTVLKTGKDFGKVYFEDFDVYQPE